MQEAVVLLHGCQYILPTKKKSRCAKFFKYLLTSKHGWCVIFISSEGAKIHLFRN
jgi:hypothetical protein